MQHLTFPSQGYGPSFRKLQGIRVSVLLDAVPCSALGMLIIIPPVILGWQQLSLFFFFNLCVVDEVLITLAVLQVTGFSWLLSFLFENVAASALFLLQITEQTQGNSDRG